MVAKVLVDTAPCNVKANVSKQGAEMLKRELCKNSAEVTIEQKQ